MRENHYRNGKIKCKYILNYLTDELYSKNIL